MSQTKRSFMSGLLLGAAVSAAGLLGYAYGQATPSRIPSERLDAAANARCNVRVGFPRRTSLDECGYNRVMVGESDGYIKCATIEVTCR